MNLLKIDKIFKTVSGNVQITGSKSESNRLLVLQQFYPNLSIENVSNSDDSKLMQKALASTSNEINIGHAGTAMRFLTAYFSVKLNSEIILTGSHRMKNRPIKILVAALTSLGANIEYLEKEGYPPLKIIRKKMTSNFIEIDGNVSSQYISALLLIAPTLKNGLQLKFKGEVTSVPYIKMTLQLLAELNIKFSWENNMISIFQKPTISDKNIVVESDWSSASYYYSLVALSPNSEITLSSYKKTSLQGDSVLATIYKDLGVKTTFKEQTIILKNTNTPIFKPLELDLISAPDIAQTIAVTCLGLGIACFLKGLHTLKIKETDRLVALKTEIEKLGGEVIITNETLHLKTSTKKIKEHITISTYDDHRMAMAFAPLAVKVPIQIEDANVVSKSYPAFWKDFKKLTT
ncbi:MAG: 3-phosphoshikimate 1-carboxyvinyltransferase [Lutibacter sp.]|uniref:3-phosphoshikimate 1-carboxyvinyltransferase n=1 Tax=Lutibacter sp. TaxID=1925666 RepID=UPI00385F5A79